MGSGFYLQIFSSFPFYICNTAGIILVFQQGNNKNRSIDYHNTTDYAEEVKGKLFETSSKNGDNISELFLQIAKDYMDNKANHLESFDDFVSLEKPEKSRSCCGKSTSE